MPTPIRTIPHLIRTVHPISTRIITTVHIYISVPSPRICTAAPNHLDTAIHPFMTTHIQTIPHLIHTPFIYQFISSQIGTEQPCPIIWTQPSHHLCQHTHKQYLKSSSTSHPSSPLPHINTNQNNRAILSITLPSHHPCPHTYTYHFTSII